MLSQQEAFWDRQRESLNRLRQQIVDQHSQRRASLASRTHGARSQAARRRSEPSTDSDVIPRVVDHTKMREKSKSTTPPPRSLPRMVSPADRTYKNGHQKKVRGSKYNVVPPVKPKKAFQSRPPRRREPSSDDSWGESESESSDEYAPGPPYPQYPYPYMMPPPMYAPPPIFYQTRYRPRRRKRKERPPKPQQYVLRPTHDQATHTVHEQGTQWVQPSRTREIGNSPISRAVSHASTRGGTQRSRGRKSRGGSRAPSRDVPVEIFVTPASRAARTGTRLTVPEPEPEPYHDDGGGMNGYEEDFDDESIYSNEEALESYPEVPPRVRMPKYYYYYSTQRPRYNRDLFDERSNSVLRRYKYFYQPDLNKPQQSDIIEEEEPRELAELPYDLQVLKTLLDDERFAESVVNKLIDDFLYEDIVPDLLIDALSINTLPSHHPLFGPSKLVSNDILQTEVIRNARDVVREVVREMVDDYLDEQDRAAKDPLEEFLDNLFTEAIMENLFDIAQDAVNEMAHEYIVEKAIRAVIMMMVNEIIEADGQNLLDEAVYEVMIEGILDECVYNGVIDDYSREVAHEVLNEYDSKIRRQAIKEINRLGREKLLESSILDALLTKIARDGKIWTMAEYMDKMMHGLMLEITLKERLNIQESKDATIDNKALKKVHEKMVTDVALDVVLDELTQWLDEDLAELDERERGINVQDDCLPTEVNAWLFGEVAELEPRQTPDNGEPEKRFSRFAKSPPMV